MLFRAIQNAAFRIFSDCSAEEIYLMLSVAETLKRSLRLKKIKLTRE